MGFRVFALEERAVVCNSEVVESVGDIVSGWRRTTIVNSGNLLRLLKNLTNRVVGCVIFGGLGFRSSLNLFCRALRLTLI